MTQDDTEGEKATPALSTSGIVDQVDEEAGRHALSMPPGILNIQSTRELVSKDLELIAANIYFVPDHPEFVALQLQGLGG